MSAITTKPFTEKQIHVGQHIDVNCIYEIKEEDGDFTLYWRPGEKEVTLIDKTTFTDSLISGGCALEKFDRGGLLWGTHYYPWVRTIKVIQVDVELQKIWFEGDNMMDDKMINFLATGISIVDFHNIFHVSEAGYIL